MKRPTFKPPAPLASILRRLGGLRACMELSRGNADAPPPRHNPRKALTPDIHKRHGVRHPRCIAELDALPLRAFLATLPGVH
jgi:hypothetical protein